jgi:hypothetical protein
MVLLDGGLALKGAFQVTPLQLPPPSRLLSRGTKHDTTARVAADKFMSDPSGVILLNRPLLDRLQIGHFDFWQIDRTDEVGLPYLLPVLCRPDVIKLQHDW